MTQPGVSLRETPAGVCPSCLRFCWSLHQVGLPCFWCHRAAFTHRSSWTFTRCPPCTATGPDPFCPRCHGRNVVAAAPAGCAEMPASL